MIVIADTDLLANQHWVQEREVLGQKTQVPTADNAAFILGVLENLSGSDALIALRGRGVKERPFTMVEEIRRDSEKIFREKEQALTAKLKTVEGELQKLEVVGEDGKTLITDKEREMVDKFRGEMIETRRELRDVKLDLGKTSTVSTAGSSLPTSQLYRWPSASAASDGRCGRAAGEKHTAKAARRPL